MQPNAFTTTNYGHHHQKQHELNATSICSLEAGEKAEENALYRYTTQLFTQVFNLKNSTASKISLLVAIGEIMILNKCRQNR